MPRYTVHNSAAPTPVVKIRPTSCSVALGATSVVVIPITLSLVAGHAGGASVLA